MLICFSTFLKVLFKGMYFYCRWTNYTPWCFLFFSFFIFFRKQKSTVSGWQQKVCGSLFPAKHDASNVKAAVVTQLDYSHYSKNKPLFFPFPLPSFFFFFPGRLQRQNNKFQNHWTICVVPPFPCSVNSFPVLRTVLAIGRTSLKKWH